MVTTAPTFSMGKLLLLPYRPRPLLPLKRISAKDISLLRGNMNMGRAPYGRTEKNPCNLLIPLSI